MSGHMSGSQARVVDPVLSTHAQGYKNADFVGMALFPSVNVAAAAGRVIEFGREAFVRYAARRSPGATTKRVPIGYFGRPYTLANEALDASVPRELKLDADAVPGVDLAMRAVNVVSRALALGIEVDQATIARDTASYPASNRIALAGGARFDDTGVNPLPVIEAGMEAVRTATGIMPNVMILPSKVYRVVRRNTFVTALFDNKAGVLNVAQLAAAFDVKRVLVAGAVQASTAEPLVGPMVAGTFSDIWGKDVILAYAPEQPSGEEEPSYGYTYTRTGHPFVEQARWDGDTRSWVYGVSYERAPVLAGQSAGYLIQNAIN